MDASVSSAFDDISISMEGTQEAAEIEEAEDTDAALIDVEDLVTDMKRMLDVLPESEPYTFPRVLVYIREGNKNLYDPMSLAIGPYHHGREHLQGMERYKWRFLRDLLFRSTTEASLEDCLRTMKTLEDKARRCYSESSDLKSDEFVKMMVLDSCFIIEFFWKIHESGYFNFNMIWGISKIRLDLLLIENQIPFFVIEELFNLVVGRAVISSPSGPSLNEHIQPLFQFYTSLVMQSTTKTPPAKIHHLLHHYYHVFVPTEDPSESYHRSPLIEKFISLFSSRFPCKSSESENSSKADILMIPSASVLHEAGVIFRKKDSPRSNLDITFRNGLMEIPFFQMDDATKPLFTNLIAFEQSMPNEWMPITSFCTLMDSLINTEKDVALLQQCGIIDHFLGSEEEVARVFNDLCVHADIDLGDHYFCELFRHVNCYRDFRWNRYRARLAHDYFSNPWAILSLVAALILLALTFLQTFFATDSYFHPP